MDAIKFDNIHFLFVHLRIKGVIGQKVCVTNPNKLENL